jgi:hypothetical protein
VKSFNSTSIPFSFVKPRILILTKVHKIQLMRVSPKIGITIVVIAIIALVGIIATENYFSPTSTLTRTTSSSVSSSLSISTSISNDRSSPIYNVSISYAANPIVRGNNQTIYVTVAQGSTSVPNMVLNIHVTYASLKASKDFVSTTNSTGTAQATWLIGANLTPGSFLVVVTIQGHAYNSTFLVNSA